MGEIESAPLVVLVVVVDPSQPLELSIPGVEFEVVGQHPFPGQRLEEGAHDAVLIHVPVEDLQETVTRQIEEHCAAFALPLFLSSWPSIPRTLELLRRRTFDGFLDLGWEPTMQGAALLASFKAFQVGRNVVEIQREVLSTAKDEVVRMRALSRRDDLTNLNNLRHFEDTLEKEHARCERHGGSYSIVYLDIDGLRAVNTRLGHAAGAAALVAFGEVVAQLTRAENFAFRVGGDEFVSLIVGSRPGGAMIYARRLCETYAATPIIHGRETFHLTVSAGIASYPEDGTEAKEILRRADEAVYRAKVECPGEPLFWSAPKPTD